MRFINSRSDDFGFQGRMSPMLRFAKTSLTTIALTTVALATITGRRAQSADTDLRPAIQEMRDEIRELRSDVKALRELLERREDRAADTLPDLPGVHLESYLESNTALRAQASVNKMTGNEIIASIDGRPVFASEIFQRAFTAPLTPEGTSLLVATQSLAAGKISEQDFRELQVFAIRKFAKDYIRTRALSQAMIASLGKTQKEKAEDAIAKEFNNYLERLKKDFNVTTAFEVDKRLRKQGTSLLSLKDEFRDRLLADEYLRGSTKGKDEPPAKVSPTVGHPDDRPTYAYFFYSKKSSPCQQMMPIIDRLQAEGHRIVKVDVDAPMTWEQTLFKVTEVPTIWTNAGDEGAPLSGIQTEEKIRQTLKHFGNWHYAEPARQRPESHAIGSRLDRPVTIACDDRPLSEVLDLILPPAELREKLKLSEGAFQKTTVVGRDKLIDVSDLDGLLKRHVTLRVSDVTARRALRLALQQVHLAYELKDGILTLVPDAQGAGSDALSPERRVTVDCDNLPLSEVLEQIFHDRPKIEFRYEQAFFTLHDPYFHFPASEFAGVRSAQKFLDALDARCPQRVTLHVADVPVSVALQRVFNQVHVHYEFENGILRIEFPEKLREALQRRVNFDCEKLSLKQFTDHIWKDWHLGNVVAPLTVNLQAPITIHVKEATLESVLKQGFQQAGVRCEYRDEVFLLSPAVNATEEERWIGEQIAKQKADPEGKFIAEIVVEGNSKIPASAILQKLKVTTDRKTSIEEIQDDVRTLWQTGWFKTVETKFRHPLKGPGQVLVFVVFERPAVPSVQPNANKDINTKKFEPLVLRVYPVADLLTTPEQAGIVRAEKIDFNSLEKLIRTAAEPQSWEESGGQGQMHHIDATLSLVIRQTQPVHAQIMHLLRELRKPQQLKVTFRTVFFNQHAVELIEAAGIDGLASHGGTPTLLARDRCDFLLRLAADASRLSPLATMSADLGKEQLIRPFPGEHVWPESIQAISGQIGGRAYIWFELTGTDPTTGQPHREGVMSLAPEFKPVLIPVRMASVQKPKGWPLGPSHTVDEWAKVPEGRFLLIRPLVESSETSKDQEERR